MEEPALVQKTLITKNDKLLLPVLAFCLYSPSGWGSPRTGGTCPACIHMASLLVFQTRAGQHDHALQHTQTHTVRPQCNSQHSPILWQSVK